MILAVKILESRHHASVVRAQIQTNRILLQPPNVTFVQSRKDNNGLIIIIDNGPQLTPEKWSVLRQGELYSCNKITIYLRPDFNFPAKIEIAFSQTLAIR